MTEEEAKGRWCPYVRVPDTESGASYNRTWRGEVPLEGYCIGSTCMAWRWNRERNFDGTLREKNGGYCGLAGKP